jgi:hypothetical protein
MDLTLGWDDERRDFWHSGHTSGSDIAQGGQKGPKENDSD